MFLNCKIVLQSWTLKLILYIFVHVLHWIHSWSLFSEVQACISWLQFEGFCLHLLPDERVSDEKPLSGGSELGCFCLGKWCWGPLKQQTPENCLTPAVTSTCHSLQIASWSVPATVAVTLSQSAVFAHRCGWRTSSNVTSGAARATVVSCGWGAGRCLGLEYPKHFA